MVSPAFIGDYYKDDPEGFRKVPVLGGAPLPVALTRKHTQIPDVQIGHQPNYKSIWNAHFCCGLPSRTYSSGVSVAPIAANWAEAKEKGLGTEAHRLYMNVNYYQLRNGLEPEQTAKRLLFTQEEEVQSTRCVQRSTATSVRLSPCLPPCDGHRKGLTLCADLEGYGSRHLSADVSGRLDSGMYK